MNKLKKLLASATADVIEEAEGLADKIKDALKKAQAPAESGDKKKYPEAKLIDLGFKFPLDMDIPVYWQPLPKGVFGYYIPEKYTQRGVAGPAILICKSHYKKLKENKCDASSLTTIFHELGHHWQDTQYDVMGTMNLNEKDLVKRYINYTSKERVINQHAKMIVQQFFSDRCWAKDVIAKLDKAIKRKHFEYRCKDKVIAVHKTNLGFLGKEIDVNDVKSAVAASFAEDFANKEMGTDDEDLG